MASLGVLEVRAHREGPLLGESSLIFSLPQFLRCVHVPDEQNPGEAVLFVDSLLEGFP